MRDLDYLNEFRKPHFSGEMGDSFNGCFILKGPCNMRLRIIASNEEEWDHVSISLNNRVPNYKEMCWVKEKFFNDNEVAYQLHVAKKDHINCHPFCLHLWRPLSTDIPLPPKFFVGPK